MLLGKIFCGDIYELNITVSELKHELKEMNNKIEKMNTSIEDFLQHCTLHNSNTIPILES